MEIQEIYLTIVTTFVAIFGLLFTWLQFILAKKKRKDDLFNLRYEFYKDISNIWTSTCNPEMPPLDIVDLIPLAEKGNFLFGKDISSYIISLENKTANRPFFPDEDFTKPFVKYLKL
ncbi:hypothetical protein [Flavobacterium sp. N502540]|uniref:hypothetical protein n=1 Tax=Flavobacterium sp. N502540 TaxID=2986838 RepID=UPI002223F3EB|nr:hypothetical protein [Flavobacterium sp. N502540]